MAKKLTEKEINALKLLKKNRWTLKVLSEQSGLSVYKIRKALKQP